MTEEIYKPPGVMSLAQPDENQQLRVGLQGEGGTGKSIASSTFKNPIFISYDRGLAFLDGDPRILNVKFYDGKFVDSIVKRDGTSQSPNRKDALIKWLSTEGLKLTRNQTCIFDANTGIQAAYHIWYELNKDSFTTKTGEENKFKEWRLKINYYTEIMLLIKEMRCDIIFIWHESPDRNEKGDLNGQVRPLITGQFQDECKTHFTDWFRAHAFPKPKNEPESWAKFKENFRIDDTTAKEWINSTPPEHQAIYLWQTQSDAICKCKTSLNSPPKFILAHSKSFEKYKRQQPKEQ